MLNVLGSKKSVEWVEWVSLNKHALQSWLWWVDRFNFGTEVPACIREEEGGGDLIFCFGMRTGQRKKYPSFNIQKGVEWYTIYSFKQACSSELVVCGLLCRLV